VIKFTYLFKKSLVKNYSQYKNNNATMFDDIYYRLFLKVIAQDPKLRTIDTKKLLKAKKHTSNSANYGHLIDLVYKIDPDSNFGLLYGKYLSPSILCDFSRMLLTAENFASCLDIVPRLSHILNPQYYPVITRKNGVVSASITFPFEKQVPTYLRRFCAESLFSYTINGFREMGSGTFEPLAVCLDYPAPSYANEYQSLLGCKVHFNQPLNVIKFSEDIIYKPLNTRNPILHDIYSKKCLDASHAMGKNNDFEYRVICNIMRHHPQSFNSRYIAEKFNISIRGLQKRLSKNGGSYSNLANLARRELAKVYLQEDSHNLETTAEKLGFQTSSGFRKFFKTEYSKTPSEFMSDFCDTRS
jgi:AraC-like DNA-binding protein